LLRFEQGSIHEDYLLHLYDLFKIHTIKTDVYASRPKAHYNTRLGFDQSPFFNEKKKGSKEKHSDYLNYLYSLFEPFVGTEPTSTNRKPDKKNRFKIR
jgi:hypothetical protein